VNRTTMDYTTEVEAVIGNSNDIAKADYLRWTRQGDLATRARAFRLSESAWERIYPEPTMSEQCGFMADYLLQCLVANPVGDEFIHSGVEAGHMMAAWLKHLSTIPAATAVIDYVAARLASAYRTGDAKTRNRIETAALEHLLESPRLRPFFGSWSTDPVLHEAYQAALGWGLAHAEETG
jgi:hypothetical protein